MSHSPAFTDRLPPYNREAEQSVLGSMLRDNHVIDDVVNILAKPEYFYTDAHQKIFQAILDLNKEAHPVDLVTLADVLFKQKLMDDVGGAPYLAQLWDAAPTAANALYYARIVREKGILRSLVHKGTEIVRDAYDQSAPADELLESAERRILEIAEMGATGQTVTLHDALQEAYKRIDARTKKEDVSLSGVPSGFLDLDEKTAGFQASELIIIAARPSVGKTAFALNIARNAAVDNGVPVFFVSLEQSRIEIAERLLCCQSRVDSHKIRKGYLNGEDTDRLLEAGHLLSESKIFIDDVPGQGMMRIAANARRLKRRHDLKMVVIDYLQLIEPESKRDSRQEQVGQISRRLKFLARELEIPVIALAQVNRSSEDRQDHRPRMSDLRESGAIEQDADTIMLLHRPDYHEPGQHEGIIEVIISKQRNGPTGEITLSYLKQYMKFENFAVEPPFGYSG